mmetsp:Transcript_70935/g.208167  ORF Transcript_70935/g.208167 Transcript_70935/m.208167 type:complete len:272 (-) Transcript_70935:203-1018(-)
MDRCDLLRHHLGCSHLGHRRADHVPQRAVPSQGCAWLGEDMVQPPHDRQLRSQPLWVQEPVPAHGQADLLQPVPRRRRWRPEGPLRVPEQSLHRARRRGERSDLHPHGCRGHHGEARLCSLSGERVHLRQRVRASARAGLPEGQGPVPEPRWGGQTVLLHRRREELQAEVHLELRAREHPRYLPHAPGVRGPVRIHDAQGQHHARLAGAQVLQPEGLREAPAEAVQDALPGRELHERQEVRHPPRHRHGADGGGPGCGGEHDRRKHQVVRV